MSRRSSHSAINQSRGGGELREGAGSTRHRIDLGIGARGPAAQAIWRTLAWYPLQQGPERPPEKDLPRTFGALPVAHGEGGSEALLPLLWSILAAYIERGRTCVRLGSVSGAASDASALWGWQGGHRGVVQLSGEQKSPRPFLASRRPGLYSMRLGSEFRAQRTPSRHRLMGIGGRSSPWKHHADSRQDSASCLCHLIYRTLSGCSRPRVAHCDSAALYMHDALRYSTHSLRQIGSYGRPCNIFLSQDLGPGL